MAIRLIDGETLWDKLENALWYDNYDRDMAEKIVLDMPTLTLPNEKLTCDGCIHEYDEHENCNYCQRAPFLSDYYRHYSPKE